jgi:hypothetical protein
MISFYHGLREIRALLKGYKQASVCGLLSDSICNLQQRPLRVVAFVPLASNSKNGCGTGITFDMVATLS